METRGAWGLVVLFGFVIISVMLYKGVMNAIGKPHLADLA